VTTRLRDTLDAWIDEARSRARARPIDVRTENMGVVERVGDGIALLSGLPGARLDELLDFGDGTLGMAVSMERDTIGCVLLSEPDSVVAGMTVHGTAEVLRTPVGPGLLGRIVDPLGRPLDGGPEVAAERRDPVERPAPGIVDRDLVRTPMQTGISVIDAMIPLGRGQRELIIGDRKTGKTAIAVDTIINQRDNDVICVYAAVGQKASSVNQVIDAVRAHGNFEQCVFVVGEAKSPPGLQWLAPYAACTIAEYYRDMGRDALLVIDDLTKHAAIYREISLLLRHPPGREAYPGDIFYIHSRLLERAAKLSKEAGGGSLTALPIAETQEGNIAAYIPTNLISITDGQIYLDPKLFYLGQKPAVNVGKSVSRVGGKTQPPAIKDLAESLKLDYMQFLELEVFTRFGAMVDERTQALVEHGRRVRSVLIQPRYRPWGLAQQVALLSAIAEGILDPLSLDAVERFKEGLSGWLDEYCRDVVLRIDEAGEIDDADRRTLLANLEDLADAVRR
jgi:F-type H+-transporting ATPase subunit alpha